MIMIIADYHPDAADTPSTMIVTTTDKHPEPGGRLNKKDGLTRYGDSHVKDKTS